MASMGCRCGERLSNSAIPNDIELWFYTDNEWDSIWKNDVMETWRIPLPYYSVWRCPKCERVYVFENNKTIKVYKLEE